MKGKIRTREYCRCGSAFMPIINTLTKDIIDLLCSACYEQHNAESRPRYYYLDCRDFKAGKIYKNKLGQKFDSFLAASRQLEEMRAQFDRGDFAPSDWMPKLLKEHTLKEMSDKWLKRVARDKSYSYARHSTTEFELHILPAIGHSTDVRALRTLHSEKIQDAMLDKRLQPKTIKNVLGTWQTFLRWLVYLEIIQHVPNIPQIKVPLTPGSWINREKQQQILYEIPIEHRLIFETLIETGERVGEVCAHYKTDLIDGEFLIERAFDERGSLKERKSGTSIYKSLSINLYGKLAAQSKQQSGQWLFTDKNGQQYSQNRLYRIWVSACKKVGIKISLQKGTRTSRASQIRLKMEKQAADVIGSELGNTPRVARKHYARDRREEI